MTEFIVRLPVFIIVWMMSIAVKFPTALLGLVIVPALYRYRNTNIDQVPKILTPWLNPEDWTGGTEGYTDALPDWWKKREGQGFKSFYRYHAIRNPADGLRNFRILNLQMDREKIKFLTPEYIQYYEPWHTLTPRVRGYIAWQGFKAGFKLQIIWGEMHYFVWKFGFRVEPRDALEGWDPDGTRALYGASFASKFLPYRHHGKGAEHAEQDQGHENQDIIIRLLIWVVILAQVLKLFR